MERSRVRLIILIAASNLASCVVGITWVRSAGVGFPSLSELSAIGEAFGTISAFLSALALVGVLAAIRLQRQQTSAARLEGLRLIRMQLIQFAFHDQKLLAVWGIDPSGGLRAMQLTAYYSMVYACLKMAYILKVLTDLELTRSSQAAFADQDMVNFWKQAREIYVNDSFSKRSRQFAKIIDEAYTNAVMARPQSPPAEHREHLQILADAGAADPPRWPDEPVTGPSEGQVDA